MASSAAGDNTFIAEFPLSASSFLKINKGDITKWFINGSSDSFISCFNEGFLISWCIRCLAIHRAAGPELREACFKVPEVSSGIRCPTGEARITPGFKLPASHVIHTVGPIYDSDPNPGASLKNAYKYPFEEAAGVAISTIKELANDFKEVHFVLFADDIYDVWVKKAKELL
ncbi:Macro domain-containing protein XCC3184 [Linum perenne]